MSGLRESNKQDKLRRIKRAAKSVFSSKTFDESTTKEISELAKVGTGTLFQYASDKRDLVFLVASDDLSALTQDMVSSADNEGSFLDQIGRVFELHYVYYAANREIAKVLLKELPFYKRRTSAGATAMTAHYEVVVRQLISTIRSSIAQKEITPKAEPELVADVLFSVFGREVRRWLDGPDPQVQTGLARLRASLRVVVDGLGPGPGAY